MIAALAEHINEARGPFDRVLGWEATDVSTTSVRARVAVREELTQPYGLVHGGVFASIAESVASWATAVGAGEGYIAVGLSNATSFLRPVTHGTVHVSAERLHGGRTTWVWDVAFRDDAERLCAITRMTVAVREAPAQAEPLSGS